MEKWYRVKEIAELMGCCNDTAKARMRDMPGVINVGTAKRQQLMVPEYGLEDWLRNHTVAHVSVMVPPMKLCRNGQLKKIRIREGNRMARINRHTGKLEAI